MSNIYKYVTKNYHIVDNNSKTNINKIVSTHLIMKLYTVGCIS